jgi:hypothetical protein
MFSKKGQRILRIIIIFALILTMVVFLSLPLAALFK